MALFETWFACCVSVPTTLLVTAFLVSILKLQCAIQSTTSSSPSSTGAAKGESMGDRLFKWSGIICLCLFWTRSFIQSMVFTILVATGRDQEDHLSAPLEASWLFYASGLWLMLVSFVFRIQFSFEKHPYLAYSPWMIKILYFLLLLALVMVILIYALDHPAGMAIAYATIAFHVLFSVLMSYALFSKIFNVMHQRLDLKLGAAVRSAINGDAEDQDSHYNEYGGVATESLQSADINDAGGRTETPDVESRLSESIVEDEMVVNRSLNQIPLKSIKTVTRFALLMFMGIISTYFATVFVFLDIEVGYSMNQHILTVASIFMVFDLLINAIAVYLLFEYSTSKYHALCGRCHWICEIMCVEMIYWHSRRTDPSGVRVTNTSHRNDFSDLILKDDFDTENTVI